METFVGVDFAAKAKDTWEAVGTETSKGRLKITEIRGNISDEDLVEIAGAGHQVIAIDAPFGWPDGFVSFVETYHMGRTPAPVQQVAFRFRTTDKGVHDRFHKWPLSVSTDRLGIVAHRLISLLSRLTDCDIPPFWKNGRTTTIIEVYPAATLLARGLSPKGYKAEAKVRRCLLRELDAAGLEIPLDLAERCIATDDALDAAVCAWTSYLYYLGETVGPPAGDMLVRHEGWIFAPESTRSIL